MRKPGAKRNNRGYTLTEMLVTVAIIVVLIALAFIPLKSLRLKIRQNELDAKAEMIYAAAQNTLSNLKAGGQYEKYAEGVPQVKDIPRDADTNTVKEGTLFYVCKDTREVGEKAGYLLPENSIEKDIRKNSWVIEYNRDSASVYAVFYWENSARYDFYTFDSLRYKADRIADGARVGYYGGDAAEAGETDELLPKITVTNGEKLSVRLSCDPVDSSELTFTLKITGQSSGASKEKAYGARRSGRTWYVDGITLDDLTSEDTRFASLYPDFIPGENLTLSLTVKSANRRVKDGHASETVNSLFASRNGDTVVVKCGRHLQNLDISFSGVSAEIKNVRQESNIFFSDVAGSDDDWYDVYGNRSFIPVNNENIKTYEGSFKSYTDSSATVYTVIYGMNTANAADSGLFGVFSGTELNNIRLVNTCAKTGATNAGALAGVIDADGNVTIDGCRVYLEDPDGRTEYPYITYVSASNAGGMIGLVRGSGSLGIKNSFASTVVYGGSNAGGLVGRTERNIKIEHSYADCYLSGANAGGLAGTTASGCGISLDECYSAGFAKVTNSGAGLVCGTINGAQNVYSALDFDNDSASGAALYSTGKSGSSNVKVFYLSSGNTNPLAGTNSVAAEDISRRSEFISLNLSNAFESETGGVTFPYNMKTKGLQDYSYPKLRNLEHYGDWQATFEEGSLVYYEKYSDGTYGFYGANEDTLRTDKTVVGDGYGLIYKDKKPTSSFKVHYYNDNGSWVEQNMAVNNNQRIIIDTKYSLVALPSNVVNTKNAPNSFYQKVQINEDVYYYNPHFAQTAVMTSSVPALPKTVYIRTARQLNNLARYYSNYRQSDPDKSFTFVQVSDISYGSYDWANYGIETVTVQPAIGEDAYHSFRDSYNGGYHTVKGISFTTNPGKYYAGLFGLTTGTVQNVVLVSEDYGGTVGFNSGSAPQGANTTAYLGTLAGRNDGYINNCAVAGYTAEVKAYTNCYVYSGGFAGYNAGVIRNSSAVTRVINVYNSSANVRCGSFAGANTSEISRCYGLGYTEVKESTGTAVTITAGFSAQNTGTVRNCYCASTSVSAGTALSYGFMPIGGSVSGCYYLNGATYRFIDSLYSYNNSNGAGTAKDDEGLRTAAVSGFSTAQASLYHDRTIADGGYPYPAVVTDSTGKTVHYGDWTTGAVLGNVGVFYWEHEVGGSNEGYHVYYVGVKETPYGDIETADTLCTSHDDGGVITEYGYGYYEDYAADEANRVKLKTDGNSTLGSVNTDASNALHSQFTKYSFYAYTTGSGSLCMQNNMRNSDWTLTKGGYQYSYTVSPFFGNSFSYKGVRQGNSGNYYTGDLSDKCPDKVSKPGTEDNEYEIRSVAQLQFINWNYSTKNTDTIVTKNNYKQYPYLQYTTNTGTATQTADNAYRQQERSGQYWIQTHDSDGSNTGNFTPIAATYETSTTDTSTSIWSDPLKYLQERFDSGFNAVLYTWFGGSFNGQSYKLININITSDAVNVGLFGTTAGADMRNIVMYSDKNSTVLHSGNRLGAYAVGGLIGVAYDYKTASGHVITNCAISGYTVKDSFTGKLTPGEANMGGLIGIANVSLTNCSAVNNIVVDTEYSEFGGYHNKDYGNFLRVGGLVGANVNSVTNCYSGGEITVEEHSRMQFCKNSNKTQEKSTNIYIGGIGGSSFGANYQNFSNSGGAAYHNAVYENCYTYIKLPNFGGAVRVVSTIASVADRQGRVTYTLLTGHEYTYSTRNNDAITIRNCYYLDTIANIKDLNGSGAYVSEPKLQSNDLQLTLEGKISKLSRTKSTYYWRDTDINSNGPSSSQNITVTPVTYQQMKDTTTDDGLLHKLGTFSTVTTEENGAKVYGKYSFAGGIPELEGLDYPFPTILTQQTASGGTANVHYGEWPTGDLYWEKGLNTFDVITEEGHYLLRLKYEGSDSAESVIAGLRLSAKSDIDEELDSGTVTFGTVSFANGYYNIPVTCLKQGAYRITAEYTDAAGKNFDAVCQLLLTAVVNVDVDGDDVVEIYKDSDSADFRFTAVDNNGNDITDDVEWTFDFITEGTDVIAEQYDSLNLNKIRVQGVNAGDEWIEMTASRRVGTGENALIYTGSASVEVIVLEPSVLGMHDDESTEEDIYNRILIPGSNRTGINKLITDEQPDPGENVTLFIYAKGEHAVLTTEMIGSMSVYAESGSGLHKVYSASTGEAYPETAGASDDGKFFLEVGDIIPAGEDGYSFVPMVLNCGIEGSITLHVSLPSGDENPYNLFVEHNAATDVALIWKDAKGRILGKTSGTYGETPSVPGSDVLAGWITDPGVQNTEGHWYVDPESEDYDAALAAYMGDSANWNPEPAPVRFTTRYTLRELLNVTFDANGGSFGTETVSVKPVKAGHTCAQDITRDVIKQILPDAPEGGYRFDGWYTSATPAETDEPFDFDNTVIIEDTTLYAKWQKVWTVTYHVASDPVGTWRYTVDDGKCGTAPEDITERNGCAFDGWYSDSEYSVPFDLEKDTITVDTELYARWTAKVSFVLNGGTSSAIPDQTVEYGNNAAEPAYPTRSGCEFAGWYTVYDADTNTYSGGPFDFANTAITENTTLYAKWSAGVTFNLNGYEATLEPASPQTVQYNTKAVNPTVTYDTSKRTFAGWYTGYDANTNTYSGGPFDFANTAITENTTLYAKWTAQVVFNLCGGTSNPPINPQTVVCGSTADKPDDPSLSGYRFDGWYTGYNADTNTYSGGPFEFDKTAISEDTTLYAKWQKVWTVTYHVASDPVGTWRYTVDDGKTGTAPVNIKERTGCAFDGWYTGYDADTNTYSGGPFDLANTAIRENTTLYARWKATVTFNTNDRGNVSPAYLTVDYNSTIDAPTVLGYNTNEWSLDYWYYSLENGSEVRWDFNGSESPSHVTGDVTLNAKWTPKVVTFVKNDNTSTVYTRNINADGTVAIDGILSSYTSNGKYFAGWYTEETGGTRFYGGNLINGQTTYYAHWVNVSVSGFSGFGGTHTISSDSNGQITLVAEGRAFELDISSIKVGSTTLIRDENGIEHDYSAKTVSVTGIFKLQLTCVIRPRLYSNNDTISISVHTYFT